MKQMFLPSMTKWTPKPIWTAFAIVAYVKIMLPRWAKFTRIDKIVGKDFPAEILPVVGVNTYGLVMLVIEWAPFCLKTEHVKVEVFTQIVDQHNFKLSFRMCEATIFSIITF